MASVPSVPGTPLILKGGYLPKFHRVHLTYKTHVPWESYPYLEACIKWSFVHETSDQEHPYDHTHVLMWFKKQKHVKPSYFDHNDIHPNVQVVSTDQHWSNTVKYHNKAPVFLKTSENLEITSYHDDCIKWIQSQKYLKNLWGIGPFSEYIAQKHSWAEKCWHAKPDIAICIYKSIDDMYDWQKELLQRLEEPPKRKVIWVYEAEGCKGKSQLANWIKEQMDGQIFETTATKDIAYSLEEHKTFIFDITREAGTEEQINYKTFEHLNNQRIYSNKYQNCQKTFPMAHVLVFANIPPRVDKLSKDRWEIYTIENLHLKEVDTSELETKMDVY